MGKHGTNYDEMYIPSQREIDAQKPVKRGEKQPRMIPNPLYCERCEGRGYLVADAEWDAYAVQCDECKPRQS